jgi:CRISPR-associated endonuclease Csn1
MKRVLGLDLGTTSIGWALVEEAENETEKSSIIKLGVRVNPLSVDEKTDFEKGRPLSTNAERTLKRGARRNLQRYKLRRENLIEALTANKIIAKNIPLTEIGKNTTHQTLALRARSANEKIELDELAKVLLTINKKRGYKSSRKASNDEEGVAIDGMSIAKELYERGITPGQYVLELLNDEKKYLPDFYRSDLKEEFDRIWNEQRNFYHEVLSNDLYKELQDKGKKATWAICKEPFDLKGIPLKGKAIDQRKEKYQLRASALTEKIDLEHLAIVLQEINNELNSSSGYLGAISDRSKKLYFNNLTVGQYLYQQIEENPHTSLKNQVFYRQDYLDEFEQIWSTQAKYHKELTNELKEKIRDIIIFYQRKLKSQKGLLDFCQHESWEQEYIDKTTQKTKKRRVGRKVISKSSLLFQEAKVWQNINNLVFTNESNNQKIVITELDNNIINEIFQELNIRGNQKPKVILGILKKHGILNKVSEWKTNFEDIEGNRTNQALYNAFFKIADAHGYAHDWQKRSVLDIKNELKIVFTDIKINPEILEFDGTLPGKELEKQASFQLWHLLYSAEEDVKINEEDKIKYGNNDVGLKKNLQEKFGFNPEDTKRIASITFPQDYGNLSSKALINILPELQKGYEYSDACKKVGYNHSKSFNKEELEKRILKDKLEILKKNSLRNPVVEKILNQTVNVVNQIIDLYGKPDEVRIELARELKKSAKERSEMTSGIAEATRKNDDIKKLIAKQFGIPNPSKNDVIRYKLYEELSSNGYKSLFSNKLIKVEDIFSKKIDIEHIIPKALIFDDSFSNKTLAYREVNLEKDKSTAFDYISNYKNSEIEAYTERVESLFKANAISRGKRIKLLMSAEDLPSDFIERDLRNSQYIAKKAKEMLFEVFKNVVSTSGTITSKLREDWDLINVMKELNFPKYKALGLIETETRYNKGTEKYVEREVIQDWTKRNDHRHHAMDALTVAFTKHNHIQYINNLNARYNSNHKMHVRILNIQNSITDMISSKNGSKKRRFTPPMDNFRTEAKNHIESILISFKNKNKVVTQNTNVTRTLIGENRKVQLTPRGQLHEATIYGKIKRPESKATKINARLGLDKARMITNPTLRDLVLNHLSEFNNDSKKAFSSKEIKSNPLIYKNKQLEEVVCFEELYTIRKDINPDNFKTQKNIEKVIDAKSRLVLSKRLKEFGNDSKKAFSELDKNPIWLNKEKRVSIKRVTISGVSNVEALHVEKDHLGKNIQNEGGNNIPTDFISTGNNHHIAIYKDEKGNLQENVVSFFEAVVRSNEGLPIIDKTFNNELGWEFQFTMKQNEMFVFPNDDFDVNEEDLKDNKNAINISKNLFRVQSISSKYYIFTHHLETQATNGDDFKNKKMLSGIKYNFLRSPNALSKVKKIRINHLGQIVQVGEY